MNTFDSIGEIKAVDKISPEWRPLYMRIEPFLDGKRLNIIMPGSGKKALFMTPSLGNRQLDKTSKMSLASPLASSLMRRRKASAASKD